MKVLETEVNFELGKVYKWLESNKLTLNVKKSKFMVFTNARKNVHEISVKINKIPLEKCTKYKYLGIVFDEKLNWKGHVDYCPSDSSVGARMLRMQKVPRSSLGGTSPQTYNVAGKLVGTAWLL